LFDQVTLRLAAHVHKLLELQILRLTERGSRCCELRGCRFASFQLLSECNFLWRGEQFMTHDLAKVGILRVADRSFDSEMMFHARAHSSTLLPPQEGGPSTEPPP